MLFKKLTVIFGREAFSLKKTFIPDKIKKCIFFLKL